MSREKEYHYSLKYLGVHNYKHILHGKEALDVCRMC